MLALLILNILANARLIYRGRGTLDVMTARESSNLVRNDGVIEERYLHFANIMVVGGQMMGHFTDGSNGTDRVGDSYEVLLHGKSVVGSTEDALDHWY